MPLVYGNLLQIKQRRFGITIFLLQNVFNAKVRSRMEFNINWQHMLLPHWFVSFRFLGIVRSGHPWLAQKTNPTSRAYKTSVLRNIRRRRDQLNYRGRMGKTWILHIFYCKSIPTPWVSNLEMSLYIHYFDVNLINFFLFFLFFSFFFISFHFMQLDYTCILQCCDVKNGCIYAQNYP